MPDLGTYLIGIAGYGLAIVMLSGSIAAAYDGMKASHRGDTAASRHEARTFVLGLIQAVAIAAITRWLIG